MRDSNPSVKKNIQWMFFSDDRRILQDTNKKTSLLSCKIQEEKSLFLRHEGHQTVSFFCGAGRGSQAPLQSSALNGVRTQGKGRCQLASIRPAAAHFACKMYPSWYKNYYLTNAFLLIIIISRFQQMPVLCLQEHDGNVTLGWNLFLLLFILFNSWNIISMYSILFI